MTTDERSSSGDSLNGGASDPGYYHRDHLTTFGKLGEARGELADGFFAWYGAAMGDGVLGKREKCLIALAVSHAIQCPYCIDAYTKNSLQAGADEEQMTEAVHVAAAVRAGASLVHARQMQEQAKRLSM